MRRRVRQLGVLLAVLAVVFVGIRRFAFLAVERRGLITAPNGTDTPQSFGAPFERLTITSGDRRLDATLVRAESDSAPALLVFHGTAEAISYWADTQALLRRHGVTSMVFDYSGFGSSTGTADGCPPGGGCGFRLRGLHPAYRPEGPAPRARVFVRHGHCVRCRAALDAAAGRRRVRGVVLIRARGRRGVRACPALGDVPAPRSLEQRARRAEPASAVARAAERCGPALPRQHGEGGVRCGDGSEGDGRASRVPSRGWASATRRTSSGRRSCGSCRPACAQGSDSTSDGGGVNRPIDSNGTLGFPTGVSMVTDPVRR